ncbi:hypothetical protein CDV55_107188 [Aspergillus turcosus]|nr:hypothetical protein CDV55_107188 [Aspergillus turcosus]
MATSFHSKAPNGITVPTTGTSEALRPRRKKARRACSACQKSHQTCGNERPCQSCVRRGCADSCRDGERKKPKYLEDGSYRVFTIQYNVPCRNNCASTPLNPTTPCGDIGLQFRTHSTEGQPVYPDQDFNPWTICAEDRFTAQDLNGAQIELQNPLLLDSLTPVDEAPQTDTLIAFTIGSGWSSTFLQSEYDDSVSHSHVL